MNSTNGQLLVCRLETDVTVEWLEVRRDPDAGILLVPTDDGPLVGVCDVRLAEDETYDVKIAGVVHRGKQADRFARCGASVWVRPEDLDRWGSVEVGRVSNDELTAVRKMLADLARGQFHSAEGATADADPNYQELIEELCRLGFMFSKPEVA